MPIRPESSEGESLDPRNLVRLPAGEAARRCQEAGAWDESRHPDARFWNVEMRLDGEFSRHVVKARDEDAAMWEAMRDRVSGNAQAVMQGMMLCDWIDAWPNEEWEG